MSNLIGGNVTVKNAFQFDYCLEQCLESLLPVCDIINVVDSDSTDGTVELVQSMAKKHGKIQLLNYPWPNQPGNVDCILDKMNWSRERLDAKYHLHLESDEVLGAESYDYIKNSANSDGTVLGMKRLNFWLDDRQVLAPGHILSPLVIRFAPTPYWLGGDCHHSKASQTEPAANWNAVHYCTIYHYGFLRKPGPYFEKFKVLMKEINSSDRADPAMYEHMKSSIEKGENWMVKLNLPTLPFNGTHPAGMIDWLRERGYARI